MYHFFFICPPTSDYLGWFHDLATMNSEAITMDVQVSVSLIQDVESFG